VVVLTNSLTQQQLNSIIAGWRVARDVAREALEAHADDNKGDEEKFREDLFNIAR